jgi:hypothetical protein
MAYDIMLSDVTPGTMEAMRAATADLPLVAAKPGEAEVRPTQPASGTPAA